jgi:glycosyltransferase involved in cell wall biosynthesis
VGRTLKSQIHWTSYRQVTHNVVGLEIEREVLQMVYRVPEDRVSVVPLGLSDEFLAPRPAARGTGPLVCAGAITAQKNSVPLARLAREARVPILFIGRPYAEDEYWREFLGLVDGVQVRHQPFIGDRATMVKLLDSCRGAVAVSDFENWCLTAHEAAARGLPLLLRRQRWSVERFGGHARFFDEWGSAKAPAALRAFYEDCPNLPAPQVRLHSWREVAEMLKAIYERVLSNSR